MKDQLVDTADDRLADICRAVENRKFRPIEGPLGRAVFTKVGGGTCGQLVAAAGSDQRIDAAALIGSAARDSEDQFSDIDLAPARGSGPVPGGSAAAWTTRPYEIQGAIAHLDI